MSNGNLKCCGNCAFYQADAGQCVFNAPNGQSQKHDAWWAVKEGNWCGSWQPQSWRELPKDGFQFQAHTRRMDLTGASPEVIAFLQNTFPGHLVAVDEPAVTKKPRQKPAKAPQSAVAVVPDQPSPKDILTLWDAVYAAETGNPYTKGGRSGEAANARRLVRAIADQDRDWSRIERAMIRFHRDSWARGQDFNVFAQKFSQFDAEAKPKRSGGFLDGE